MRFQRFLYAYMNRYTYIPMYIYEERTSLRSARSPSAPSLHFARNHCSIHAFISVPGVKKSIANTTNAPWRALHSTKLFRLKLFRSNNYSVTGQIAQEHFAQGQFVKRTICSGTISKGQFTQRTICPGTIAK